MIKNNKISIFIFAQFFLFAGILNASTQVSENNNLDRECYMIMVGKDATTDGLQNCLSTNPFRG